jgi:hypothetical protein
MPPKLKTPSHGQLGVLFVYLCTCLPVYLPRIRIQKLIPPYLQGEIERSIIRVV